MGDSGGAEKVLREELRGGEEGGVSHIGKS